jgi:anthranilate/para-aminobenzoate synthase component I
MGKDTDEILRVVLTKNSSIRGSGQACIVQVCTMRGGVVANSVPPTGYQESHNKARVPIHTAEEAAQFARSLPGGPADGILHGGRGA